MRPGARIPRELIVRPFSLDEARRAGLSAESLRGRAWRRLGRGLYASASLADDPLKLLQGWMQMLPVEAVFVGFTAAWLHGLDFEAVRPVEVAVPPGSWSRSRAGLVVRHVQDIETVVVRGLRASNPIQTLVNIGHRLSPVEMLVAMDAALKAGLVECSAFKTVGRLRSLAGMALPAESPMETRLRWVLVQAGLPQPEVQTDLHDAQGQFVGRADMYYRTARLVIEYDGANHRDRLLEDNRRQNALINAGFRVLRFAASDVYAHPSSVVAQVREALAAA